MNARQLIRLLKTYPGDSRVGVCSHDQDPERSELDGLVEGVLELSPGAAKHLGVEIVLMGS